MSSSRAMIPNVFNWLLLPQATAAVVAIYASTLVFGVGAVPSVLAGLALGLHLLLVIYCHLTRTELGHHYIYAGLPCLGACAGLWCGPLSYFARHVALLINSPDGAGPILSKWAKVGCAMSALGILLNLILLGTLLLATMRQQTQDSEKNSFTSSSTDSPPQLPPLTAFHHHRISLPYPPPASPSPARNQHIPPTIILVPSGAHSPQTGQPPPPPPKSPPPPRVPFPYHTITDPTTNHLNRIALILALAHLQSLPAGNWLPTPELAACLQTWAGGRGRAAEININIGGSHGQGNGHGATALAHACLIDLCQTVWTAQREGREAEVLSPRELRSLEGVGWDLRWVGERIRRAGGWLERRR